MPSPIPREAIHSPYSVCSIHGTSLPVPSQRRHAMCTYRGKLCPKLRARKRNGALHRFCEFHRERANINQKRWASRKNHELDRQTLMELEHVYQPSRSPSPPSSDECNQSPAMKSELHTGVELDDSILAWLDEWANSEQYAEGDCDHGQSVVLSDSLLLLPFTLTL